MQSARRYPPIESPALDIVPKARIVDSITHLPKDSWNACFKGELEAYDYLLASEQAGIEGFHWRYAVVEENGTLIAAMPAFMTDYALESTMDDGILRRAVRSIQRIFPSFLVMKLACLGAPLAEHGLIGFHNEVLPSRQAALAAQLLSSFEHHARAEGYKLIGIKDIPEPNYTLWDEAAAGYSALPSLPSAYLDITFKTLDDYIAGLSSNTRKNLRRKLRASGDIRIVPRSNIDDVVEQVVQLYQHTRERSEFQFEELTAQYFTGVLARMPGHALCVLYYHHDRLLAANLLLHDNGQLLDKFFCMHPDGRLHNLYFISWLHNLQYCLDHNISHYRSGQAGYQNKERLGSSSVAHQMRFCHTNRFLNALLRLISPLLAMS